MAIHTCHVGCRTRKVEHSPTAVRAEDLGDSHAGALGGAPRAVFILGAGRALGVFTAPRGLCNVGVGLSMQVRVRAPRKEGGE